MVHVTALPRLLHRQVVHHTPMPGHQVVVQVLQLHHFVQEIIPAPLQMRQLLL